MDVVTDLTHDNEDEDAMCPIWIAIEANLPLVLDKALPTLAKILENMLRGGEKYLSLRVSNKLLTKNVWPCEGALELLMSCGMKRIEKEGQLWLSLPHEELAAQRPHIIAACTWLNTKLPRETPSQIKSNPETQEDPERQERLAQAKKREQAIREQKQAEQAERKAILGRYKEDCDTRKVYKGNSSSNPGTSFAYCSSSASADGSSSASAGGSSSASAGGSSASAGGSSSASAGGSSPITTNTNESSSAVVLRIRLPGGSNRQLTLQGNAQLSYLFEAVGQMGGLDIDSFSLLLARPRQVMGSHGHVQSWS
jgi:hypothetical protein